MSDLRIHLTYPEHWVREPNPSSWQAEERTLHWLRSRGVVCDSPSERDFREMNVAEYAGRPFPLATPETLELLMKVLTLWLMYDDTIEGLSETAPDLLLDSVCGVQRMSGQDSTMHRAWLDLGAFCLARMSPAWMARHRRRFATWLSSIKEEARMVQAYRSSGVAPSLLEYLSVRMTTIGVVPTLDFLEMDIGAELPEEFLSSDAYRDLEVAATLLVILQNDITGFNKDRRNRWLNGAQSAAGPDGDELDGLFALVELHDAYVALMARRADELRDHSSAVVRLWVERLCLMVGGWSKWHLAAERYDHELTLSGNRQVRLESHVRELLTESAIPKPDLLTELHHLCG